MRDLSAPDVNPLREAAEIFKAWCDEVGLPKGAKEGLYALGTTIMVSRDAMGEDYRNPDLPEWFPAVVVMPPEDEPGNWYRWYDPFIWYETEGDLSNGTGWCTAKRNKCYTGKLWYEKMYGDPTNFWAIPAEKFREVVL